MKKSIHSYEYGEFLAELKGSRMRASFTQGDLAERLGRTQSFVSKVERGERRLDIIELRAFCSALNISLPSFADQLERKLGSEGEKKKEAD